MVKEKHTISVNPETWELAKQNDANFSELLEEIVNIKYGIIKNLILNGGGICFLCKKKIKLYEGKRSMFPTEDKTLMLVSHCRECYSKLDTTKIQSSSAEVYPREFLELMNDVNDNPELLKVVHTDKPGLINLPLDMQERLNKESEEN